MELNGSFRTMELKKKPHQYWQERQRHGMDWSHTHVWWIKIGWDISGAKGPSHQAAQARHLPFMITILALTVHASKYKDLACAILVSTVHMPSKGISPLFLSLSLGNPQ